MLFTTAIWDTQSGEELAVLPAEGGTWQRGRVIEENHTFPLRSLGLDVDDAYVLFGKDRPRDRVLTVLGDGVPLYHGLIIDSEYEKSTGRLIVKHWDVRELASGRWLFGIGGSNQTFAWSGLSWRGMARRVARIIYTDPISAAWSLPVNVGAEESGGESLTSEGYKFENGEDLFTVIEESPGGPDLDFQPYKRNGRYGWDFIAGAPYLTGPGYEFHAQAAKSGLTDLKVTTIGAQKITGVHGIGEGSEWDMVRGGAAAPVAAGLARDTKLTLKEASLDVVNQRSAAYLASRLDTYEQWAFNVRTDDIDLAALRLGSVIRIESRGDDWIRDGWSNHRVIAFSGDIAAPDSIALTVETI